MSDYLAIPADADVGRAARHQLDWLRARASDRRRTVSRSATSRAWRRRKGCTCWPTRSSGCAGAVGDAAVRLEAAGYMARAMTARISTACARDSRRRAGGPSSPTAARCDREGKLDVSAAASTCCRCRRPTTSRRACSCSRRWRAACRWFSRAAARSRRSSSETGGGLLVEPDSPEALADGLYALWQRPLAGAKRSDVQDAAGVRAHYTHRNVPRSRLVEVYDAADAETGDRPCLIDVSSRHARHTRRPRAALPCSRT